MESQAFELPSRFNAFEHQLERGAVDLPAAGVTPIAHEPASLQSLAPQAPAAAIEVQHLDLRGTAVGEDEQVPGQRVGVEALAGQCVQAVVGLGASAGWP